MVRLLRPLCCLSATVLMAAAAAESLSPFADKPCESYSGYTDEAGKPAVLLWGKAPFNDFGSRPVTMDLTGVRTLRQAPAPGVHPRICFGPEDLPEVRARIKDTRCGQEAWKNILSWTETMKGRYDDTADYAKPDRFNGGFGVHGRVPLFRLNAPAAAKGNKYVRSEPAAALWRSLIDGSATSFPDYYWNVMALEAFRCLIDKDEAGAKECAKAVITAMRIDQRKREQERAEKQAKKPDQPLPPPAGPVGWFQFSFCYDFLFNQLTAEQKAAMHDELAATTWSHDNYGTFNTAESSRSNWATFSYWMYHVLAIEGEPGFNDLKVRGMYRGWRNLLTYGWFQSGATFEGEAKNQLGMDGIMLFSMRTKQYGFENLCGHPYLQAYARSFLPHSSNAMLTGFHKYDLLGGSRAGKGSAAPMDSLGLKYMFPDDKVIDWTYHQSMGDDYSGLPDRPDGYFNALLFYAIFATDFDPANKDPAALRLGNTFFCGERALMMTRSSWDPAAMQLNLHVRQANGGHPFADRNAIMVAGAGRIWSPNGYASFETQENSVVVIDGQSQSENVPGRMVDFLDAPLATFAVGDAKYCWDWSWTSVSKRAGYYTAEDIRAGRLEVPPGCEPELHSTNDFAFLKLPHAYLTRPLTESGHWILPSGAVSPVTRSPRFPVVKAFRSAGLVRGPQPYALVVDDIQKDSTPHRYDWTLALERDIQISRIDRRADGICDIWLTGSDPDQTAKRDQPVPATMDAGAVIPKGQPVLLVRVLNGAGSGEDLEPTIVELPNARNAKKYSPIRRLVVPARTVAPAYKVILLPHRQGDAVPETVWNAGHDTVTVGRGPTADSIRFTEAASGKTNLAINRGTASVITVDHPLPAFADAAVEQREARIAALRRELAHFDPESIPGRLPLSIPDTAARLPGKVGQALSFSGGKDVLTLPIDLRAHAGAFTIACWFQAGTPVAGTILSSNGAKGLAWSFDQGRTLRSDALGQNRWNTTPLNFRDWHHVAVTGDGKVLTLFIDGAVVYRQEIAAAPQFAPNLQLGSGFSGLVDDLRCYGRALASEELGRLYQYQAYVAAAAK